MLNFLEQFYDESFRVISKEYSDELVKAKKDYFSKTGIVQDEYSDFYEAKMNCFNDWFLFNYKVRWDDKEKFLDKLAKSYSTFNLDGEQFQSLCQAEYSLYEFVKINFRNKMIVRDWFSKKKITLPGDHPKLSVLEGEVFTGRLMNYNGNNYFLKGVCTFPNEVKPTISKQIKLVVKGKIDCSQEELLLKLENMKNEALKYSHVPAANIFKFD